MPTSVGRTAPKVGVGGNKAVAVFAGVRVGCSFPAGWVMNNNPKPIK
jgi:hypothetical protein